MMSTRKSSSKVGGVVGVFGNFFGSFSPRDDNSESASGGGGGGGLSSVWRRFRRSSESSQSGGNQQNGNSNEHCLLRNISPSETKEHFRRLLTVRVLLVILTVSLPLSSTYPSHTHTHTHINVLEHLYTYQLKHIGASGLHGVSASDKYVIS
jgi:hypothetical protein